MIQVGRIYRTPWEPSGLVRVREVEAPHWLYGEIIVVEYVGDHPCGYKHGTVGRYLATDLHSLGNDEAEDIEKDHKTTKAASAGA